MTLKLVETEAEKQERTAAEEKLAEATFQAGTLFCNAAIAAVKEHPTKYIPGENKSAPLLLLRCAELPFAMLASKCIKPETLLTSSEEMILLLLLPTFREVVALTKKFAEDDAKQQT